MSHLIYKTVKPANLRAFIVRNGGTITGNNIGASWKTYLKSNGAGANDKFVGLERQWMAALGYSGYGNMLTTLGYTSGGSFEANINQFINSHTFSASGFAFVQTTTNAVNPGTSVILTPPGAVTVNNLLVLNMKFTADPGTISITNSGTPNTYAMAVSGGGIGLFGYQYYGVQTNGGATTVTVSWVNSTAARIILDEFSGNATTNAAVFDKSATNTGTSTSGSGTLAPTSSGELISAGYLFGTAGTFTAGTDYTASTANTNGSAEYRLSGTTSETMPASWTNSVSWVLVAGAYKKP